MPRLIVIRCALWIRLQHAQDTRRNLPLCEHPVFASLHVKQDLTAFLFVFVFGGGNLGDDAHVDVLADTSGATLALEVDALHKGKV